MSSRGKTPGSEWGLRMENLGSAGLAATSPIAGFLAGSGKQQTGPALAEAGPCHHLRCEFADLSLPCPAPDLGLTCL